MFETTMPRARQAARSTMSVPVAATAIIFNFGRRARSASRRGTLLVTAMVASARRSTTSACAVAGWSCQLWAKAGGRTLACRLSRSRKTMCSMAGFESLGGELDGRAGGWVGVGPGGRRRLQAGMGHEQVGHPLDEHAHLGRQVAVLRIHHVQGNRRTGPVFQQQLDAAR